DCVVGITADSATEVVSVGEELIDRDFAITGAKDDDFIEGVARLDQRIIVILDINKLLKTA
ncbi:MAG TPA: chemotaxis protein CheW, partial [Bacillota bacterium]|nr:chemotaxis protein CheW [Bacillota bacterium]